MLEQYFKHFRDNIIGIDQEFTGPYGRQRIIYADWTASGRLYRPIEERLLNEIGPFVGNTHTGTTITGDSMTKAYHQALREIKKHVNASHDDVIISSNSGMTGVVNKFQRILGLRIHEDYIRRIAFEEDERPLILVTHMEHHSNQTSWMETIADVVIIPSTTDGMVDLEGLHTLLHRYQNRKRKYAAVTSYSNVTGIATPYHQIAEIMHEHGGQCFVDFACSAPYIDINMHPKSPLQKLDAVFFSPHKFLGGPGSTGILIFDKALYHNQVPDCPGGGTVEWTNPWGGHKYIDNIEQREDGGTPAFLQTVKVALVIKLKEQMGVEKMLEREKEISNMIWPRLEQIPNLHILAPNIKERLGIFSFYIDDLHYNLAVRLLNDRFGIQTRGGCSCAGTYGHFLLHVDIDTSKIITEKISKGDLSLKPGWVRMSVHPIMSNQEIYILVDAIEQLSSCFREWGKDYYYNEHTNEFFHNSRRNTDEDMAHSWIDKPL